jgi:hypothetical protein
MTESRTTEESHQDDVNLAKSNHQSNEKNNFLEKIGNVFQVIFIDPLSTKIGEFWVVTYIVALALLAFLTLFTFIFSKLLGPEQIQAIVSLTPSTLEFLNSCFNFIIYMVPAFLISALGSYTRILLSDYSMSVIKCFKLVVGSGFFGIATLLGIKSGIIFDLFIGHIPNFSQLVAVSEQENERIFYKIIFLCFLTGMFSTVIFMTIEEKIKILSKKENEGG